MANSSSARSPREFRSHECTCGHKWDAPVELSPATPNISGEPTPWCPECGKRAVMSGLAWTKIDDPIWIDLTFYRCDVSTAEGRAEYDAIVKKAKGLGWRLMACIDGNNGKLMDMPTRQRIDPTFLFADQYNTVEGFRVHDWYETSIVPNRRLKIGYFISGGNLDDLAVAKSTQLKCGYCGDRSEDTTREFCEKCLDSPYLEPKDLFLLRLRPVADDRQSRPPLTEAERDALMPLYVKRQTEGADSRNVQKLEKQRATIHRDRVNAIDEANDKADGLLWLMDHGLSIDNVIFYSHRAGGLFSFGWRTPVSDEVRDAILEKISEFPFPYEVKCADGKTVQGGLE